MSFCRTLSVSESFAYSDFVAWEYSVRNRSWVPPANQCLRKSVREGGALVFSHRPPAFSRRSAASRSSFASSALLIVDSPPEALLESVEEPVLLLEGWSDPLPEELTTSPTLRGSSPFTTR